MIINNIYINFTERLVNTNYNMSKKVEAFKNETKNMILCEAEDLFAGKGYEGTSIDDISSRVGITKAAIYYHFKNKMEILISIINNCIRESLVLQKRQDEIIKSITESGKQVSEKVYDKLINEMLNFLELNENTLKIILMQSIKGSGKDIPVFIVMEKYFKASLEVNECCSELNQKQLNVIKVKDFFIKFLPLINYVVFQKKWCEYHKMDKDHVKEVFKRTFIRSVMV